VLTVLTLALSALTIPNSGWYASLMYEDQALRMSRWRTSLSIVGSYPLAGIGPGKTLWATSSMRQSKFVTESYALQIVAETGLVGGLLFFGAYASAILGLLASLAVGRTRIRDARLFCITTCSMLIGYLPALVVGQSLNAPQMLTVFWAIMGLVSATLATLHNTGGWLAESGDKSQ
jgi:O-antigen ligase